MALENDSTSPMLLENLQKKAVEQIASKLIDVLWNTLFVTVPLLYYFISGFISNREFSWKDLGLEFTWTELELCLSFLLLVFLIIHCIGVTLSEDPSKCLGLEFTWTDLGLSLLLCVLLVFLVRYTIRHVRDVRLFSEGSYPDIFSVPIISLKQLEFLVRKLIVLPTMTGLREIKHDMYTLTELPIIPEEIRQMNEKSRQIFEKALREGKEKVYNIRVMVVGYQGVGKTTLIKRLLGDAVNISEKESTEGIDFHIHRCRVSHATHEWLKQNEGDENINKLQRYENVFGDQSQQFDISDEQAGNSKVINQPETAPHVKEKSAILGTFQKRMTASSSKASVMEGGNDDEVAKSSSKVMPKDKKCFSKISEEDLHQMLEQSLRNIDQSKNKDTVKNELKFLKENADKSVRSRVKSLPLTIWDFAGQYIYYTTHQTFLSPRAIYLLVINLEKLADSEVDEECFYDLEGNKTWKVHELVEFWMNSIHSCAPSHELDSPPVILVGTHIDRIQKDTRQKCENLFKHIRYLLNGRPAIFHLADEDFPINNTIVDPKLKDLQKKIVVLAAKQKHWGESIPARWLLLEELLMGLKENKVKVIPYDILQEMNQEGNLKIESKEELDLFLTFQHDIGNILYFSKHELLSKYIVLEPQWLIKAMNSLITAEDFILRKRPQAADLWKHFKEDGKLTKDLLDFIWSKEHEPELHSWMKLILLLMEQLNIIARPSLLTENGDEEQDFFLAPCMLRNQTPRDVISHEVQSSSVLCFVFKEKFLPSAIFHRLLAVCIKTWEILKKGKKNQIFCGCGVFKIDSLFRLTLYFKSYVIFARVTLAAGAKDKAVDTKVCIPIREFINENLSKILGNLSQNLKFELFIKCQCPESDGDCLDSMFAVGDLKKCDQLACSTHGDCSFESYSLLKYWFQEESSGTGPSAGPMPPLGDTDRFMRIAYLLVVVGSRVLRQLLSHHTVTSTCTLDQYLAKHRNTINRLRRVFNQSQMDILFPPNGDDTNLDDYDITLLSALFQNIVPTLSQQEKDMIKRLQEKKNKLYGHAKSCQINSSDFQTYWNDISSTLTTLSQQCGDTVFEAKILQEIQRTQVSGIPAGSYLDVLKTWFGKIEAVEGVLQNVASRLQALESQERSSASEL